jgi:hypothetical protein
LSSMIQNGKLEHASMVSCRMISRYEYHTCAKSNPRYLPPSNTGTSRIKRKNNNHAEHVPTTPSVRPRFVSRITLCMYLYLPSFLPSFLPQPGRPLIRHGIYKYPSIASHHITSHITLATKPFPPSQMAPYSSNTPHESIRAISDPRVGTCICT